MPTLEDRYILGTLEYYCEAVSFLMPYFIGFSHIWENGHVCLAFCMLASRFLSAGKCYFMVTTIY